LLSIIFSMGGAGAGVALIPILNFLGLDFTVAKAVGLFAGASTTITSSIMNLKRKVVDFKFVLPVASMMILFAPLGAYSSKFIDEEVVKFSFMLMLFYSASMMMFAKKKALIHTEARWVLFAVGIAVGFIAGLLGVGGGNILIPLLIVLGFDPKKCEVVVTRKFKGLNYDDIESIEWPGQSCPHRSWLYETSYDAQIELVEYEPVPYQLEETLREALNNAGMTEATIESNGDEMTVFYNGYQFTVLAQEVPGYAVRRARREGSDATLDASATTGCMNLSSELEATSWTLCPTSPDPKALENMLEEIGDVELDEGNGSISLILPGGTGIEAILGMAITPPVVLKGEALPPVPATDTAKIVSAQDTDGDGTKDEYTVEYSDGSRQGVSVMND